MGARKIDDDVWRHLSSNEHNVCYMQFFSEYDCYSTMAPSSTSFTAPQNCSNPITMEKAPFCIKKGFFSSNRNDLNNNNTNNKTSNVTLLRRFMFCATKIKTYFWLLLLLLIWGMQSNWNQYPFQFCMFSSIKYHVRFDSIYLVQCVHVECRHVYG